MSASMAMDLTPTSVLAKGLNEIFDEYVGNPGLPT